MPSDQFGDIGQVVAVRFLYELVVNALHRLLVHLHDAEEREKELLVYAHLTVYGFMLTLVSGIPQSFTLQGLRD